MLFPWRMGHLTPLNPISGNFLSRCRTQKEPKGKRKALIHPTSAPGAAGDRGRRLLLSPGGVSGSEPSGSASATLPLVPGTAGLSPRVPLLGTVPAGRLSSFIASEAARGCGLPPGDPCRAGGRWWQGGDTPDCAIGTLPGREQGADTGGYREGERPGTGRTGREIK